MISKGDIAMAEQAAAEWPSPSRLCGQQDTLGAQPGGTVPLRSAELQQDTLEAQPGGTVPLELIFPEARLLEAAAANSAEIAAAFARQGNRRAARAHLHRAIEQLNEAEIED